MFIMPRVSISLTYFLLGLILSLCLPGAASAQEKLPRIDPAGIDGATVLHRQHERKELENAARQVGMLCRVILGRRPLSGAVPAEQVVGQLCKQLILAVSIAVGERVLRSDGFAHHRTAVSPPGIAERICLSRSSARR